VGIRKKAELVATANPDTPPEGAVAAPASGKTVIIFRLGSLGDTVAALPCFHAIARRFPDHRRLVLTNVPVASNAAPLLTVLGEKALVQGSIAYPVGLRNIKGLLDLRKRLKAHRADALIYLAPARSAPAILRDWLFFKTCGFGAILGMPWSRDLREARVDPDTSVVEREASRLARNMAVDVGGADIHDPGDWSLVLSGAEYQTADRVLAPLAGSPFVAVNMGGKAVEKDWGVARWDALLRDLSAAAPDHALVVVGAPSDRPRANELSAGWSGRTLNLCGDLSPRESAAVLERAALFIGHDSGPLHLSAVGGAPTIGLFGDYNRPILWHPVGDHVHIIHRMTGLDRITVAEVAAAAKDRLRLIPTEGAHSAAELV
jgi:heptosyltransferase-3